MTFTCWQGPEFNRHSDIGRNSNDVICVDTDKEAKSWNVPGINEYREIREKAIRNMSNPSNKSLPP